MIESGYRRHYWAALLASCCAAALPAQAQETAPQPAPERSAGADTQDGDIVVTALKRETSLQETPISISAVTGETLTKAGVTDIAGITTPSLNFVDNGPSQRRVTIRGIQAAGEPTVGVYYDEVPVTGSAGSTNDAGANTPELRLFDVQRVEVLRGPQGTLYGSGSMGGTLRIIYNKPVHATEGAADGTVSTTDDGGINYAGNVMLNLPLVANVAAVRVSGFYSRDAGYVDNVALGIDNINRTRVWGGRAQLRVEPTSDLTIDLAAFLNRTRTDTNTWTKEAGRYNANALTRQPLSDDFNLFSATARWDLGAAALTGVVSYSTRQLATSVDVTRFIAGVRSPAICARLNAVASCDAPTLAGFYAYVDNQIPSALAPTQDMKTFTSELRLSSDGNGPLAWTVGAFFSRRATDIVNPQVRADATTGALILGETPITVRYIDDTLKQVAAFGELSWDVTDRLNLTAGIRYFDYSKNVVGQTPIGNPLVGARVTPETTVRFSEDGTTLKFNASYRITPDVMLYGGASQGFRPGGINQVIGLDPSLAPYRSDRVWDYEIGLKTSWLDNRLTLNADVFQIDWDDIQITGRTANGAFQFITNAGGARIRGAEAETTLRLARGFSLGGNVALVDAKLTVDQATSAVQAPGLKGDRIPFIPRFTAGMNAEYAVPVAPALRGIVRADVRHVSGSWSDFRPAAIYTRRIDAYDLVNARIGIEQEDDRWGVYLFATNLFNDIAITRASSSAIEAGRTMVNSAAPRTIGLNLRTRF